MLSYLFTNPLLIVAYLVALLLAITIHEFSHAYVADRRGAPPPHLQGRLSLNPRVHLDPMGLIFLFIFGFGWGKPVQFDPFNLKDPRRDAALISFAGPLSNFIVAVILAIGLRLFLLFDLGILETIGSFFLLPMISLNVMLGIFNLIPIHPLDGFKIVGGFLPKGKSHEWYELERYGMIFLLMLIFPFGRNSLLEMLIGPVIRLALSLLIPQTSSTGIL